MPDPSAWRVDNLKWIAISFNGAGAAAEGGRWNSAGVRVVYCSRHLAMAAQEKYIHLPKPVPAVMKFVKFRIDFGAVAIERLSAGALPAGWQAEPPAGDSQRIGDEWVAAARTAILAVPSALIPEEENYLLNPAHPDFARLKIGRHEPFEFDPRMARLHEP